MKKIISFLLTLVMLMSAVVYFPTVSTAASVAGKGDVNEDGIISIKDVLMLKKTLSGRMDAGSNFDVLADIDEDDRVTSRDSRYLKMYLVCEIEDLSSLESLDSNPVVTIVGTPFHEYTIVVPTGYEDPNHNETDFEVSNYIDAYNLTSPVHYIARRLRGYSGSFASSGIDSTNMIKESQAGSYDHHIWLKIDETGKYGTDGFNIKVDYDGEVYITASNSRGIVYGGIEFLEKYLQGKFYAAHTGAYADAEKAFDIPGGIDDTQNSPFKYRCVIGYATCVAGTDYSVMRRLNGYAETDHQGVGRAYSGYGFGRVLHNAHSLSTYVNGTDSGNETPCLSNSSNLETVKTAIRALITERIDVYGLVVGKTLTQVSCSMEDSNNVCDCSDCKWYYQTYGCFNAAYFNFVNQVADDLYTTYGDSIKTFSILYDRTYPASFFAEANNLPRSNMILCYCMTGCNNHTIDGDGCSASTASTVISANTQSNIGTQYYLHTEGHSLNEYDRIKAYGQLSDTLDNGFEVYYWYYPTNVIFNMCPSPNYFNILKDMRLLADAGVDGIYFESDNDLYGLEDMRDYLAAEAMWNPYMSEAEYELLMDRWLEEHCGAGWRYVKQYVLMNEEASNQKGCWLNNYDEPWSMVSRYYYRDHYTEMIDLFDSALNMLNSDDDDERELILRARVHCDFLGLSACFDDYHNEQWYKDAYLRMYTYIVNTPSYYSDGSTKCSHDHFSLGLAYTLPSSINYNQNPMCWYDRFANSSTPGADQNSSDYYD